MHKSSFEKNQKIYKEKFLFQLDFNEKIVKENIVLKQENELIKRKLSDSEKKNLLLSEEIKILKSRLQNLEANVRKSTKIIKNNINDSRDSILSFSSDYDLRLKSHSKEEITFQEQKKSNTTKKRCKYINLIFYFLYIFYFSFRTS